MIYDNSEGNLPAYDDGAPGFAIHEDLNAIDHVYSLYTDDGRGNGDFVCGSSDLYWIRHIAFALDSSDYAFDRT